MPEFQSMHYLDTLILGHVTRDLLDDGSSKLGGTVSYSGLTAHALGAKIGIISSFQADLDISPLQNLKLCPVPSQCTTTYRNISSDRGRLQYMHTPATRLDKQSVQTIGAHAKLVHFGPVADEIDPAIAELFSDSFIGLTPQGWLRGFAEDGRVHPIEWHYDLSLLKHADAIVLSEEDLGNDPSRIEFWRSVSKLLVLTKNLHGGTIYQGDKVIDYSTPHVQLIEDTGAGDIFAACFFHAYHQTGEALQAASFAAELAAASVTRRGFDSIPTQAEVRLAAQKYNIKAGLNG